MPRRTRTPQEAKAQQIEQVLRERSLRLLIRELRQEWRDRRKSCDRWFIQSDTF